MKRKLISLLIAGTLMLLAGCQQTPDTPVVEMKGGADKYESLAKSDEDETNTLNAAYPENAKGENIKPLTEELGVPEAYDADLTDNSGSIALKADGAVITIPDVDLLSVKAAINQEFSSEEIAKFAEILLGDANLYEHRTFYEQRPQSEYEETLIELRKWKAEGVTDPYNYGEDSEGNPLFDIDEIIEDYEQAYAAASEEPDWELVSKSPGENYTYAYDTTAGTYSIKKINENHILGGAVLENGRSYTFGAGTYDGKTDNYPVGTFYRSFLAMNYNMNAIGNVFEPLSEMSMSSAAKIDTASLQMTEEEAVTFADNLLSELGIEGLQLDHVEYYGIKLSTLIEPVIESMQLDQVEYYSNILVSMNLKAVYGLSYVRVMDGVPFTYTDQSGDHMESEDGYDETWPYERLTILVDDDGLINFEYVNPNQITETVAENVQLITYDQVIDIFENMIMFQYTDYLEDYKSVDLEVKEIKLGYMRVLDPDNRETGLVIPVWDFFGTINYIADTEHASDLEEDNDSQDSKYMSFLTINAVDGTIIDRDLGY